MLLHAALFDAQLDHRTDKTLGHQDIRRNDGLAQFLDFVGRWQSGRIVDVERIALGVHDFENDSRCRRDQLEVVFAFETLLDNFHVQHPEEPAPETEAERRRRLWFEMQRRVVEAKLLQRLSKILVFVRVDREQPGENAWLDLLESRQRRLTGFPRRGQRIADRRTVDILDAGDDKTDLARAQLVAIEHLRRKDADPVRVVVDACRHHLDLVALAHGATNDAHQ